MQNNTRGSERFDASVSRRTVLSTVSGVALGTTLPLEASAAPSTEEHEAVRSDVTLTPRPDETDVGGTQSLNGTWEFALSRSRTPPTTSSSRTTTPDYSPAGNDGTLQNDPAIVADPAEQAVDLADDSHVAVGDASSLDFTAPGFTIKLTFKYAEDSILFSKGGNQYSAGVYGGELSFWTEGEGNWPTASGGDLSVGRWYTATFVVDETEMRLYVDGTEVGSTSHRFSSIPSTDSPLHLGYDSGNVTHGTPVVDSFQVFETALSDGEIAEGFNRVPDSAVAWLSLDSSLDGITPDESSAGNDGILLNDPSFVSGRNGQGLDLAGQGYVSTGANNSLNFTSPGYTFQTTVKYEGGSGVLLDKGSSSVSDGTEQFGLGIYDGVVSFWMQTDSGTWPGVDGGDLATGEWYTISVVVEESEIRLFVDGSQVGSESHSASGLADSDAAVVVGGDDLSVAVKSTKAFDAALTTDQLGNDSISVPASAVLWLTYNAFHDSTVEWRSEEVPGQWAYDGYSVPSGASEWYPPEGTLGWYRREFEVPDGWQEGRLLLRFDAVYSHARVYVNGTQVTEHVGGYTPFEADISDVVDPSGTNTLAVAVSQRSEADDMGWQNVTGGITRGVTLVGIPDGHFETYAVETDLEHSGSAVVSVDATVRNAGESAIDSTTVDVTVTDPGGATVGSARTVVASLAGGASEDVILDIDVPKPQTWNPEQPRLYTVELTLHSGGTMERTTDQVGIREIQVDGNQLRLNGESLTLRGVNWEEIHLAEHGQAVPPEITRQDVKLLKAANVNYVRTAHHPTSEAFLDACDELGIIVEMEAPLMFVGRDRGDPHPETVISQVLEMVMRDRNRTSVCLWSIANESEWYDVFDTVAQLVEDLDPTRPTIFNHDVYDASDPWHDEYDVRAHHYPALRTGSTVEQHAGLSDPILFDEYAHAYCYNDRELVTDPGLRDEWGRQFHSIWERCRDADSVAGAALWAGGDHLEQWGEYLWGMVDRYRRLRPEYWHVKKAYAPVQFVDSEWTGGDTLRFTVENRYEFVDLTERTIEWESGDETGVLNLGIEPGETGTATIRIDTDDDVDIHVIHPQGFTINSITIERPTRASDTRGERGSPDGTGSVFEANGAVRAESPAGSLEVDRDSGTISVTPRGEDSIEFRCPELVVTPAQDVTGRDYASIIDHRLDGRTVTDVEIREDDDAIVFTVEYDGAEGEFVLYPLERPVRVEYDFTLRETTDARELGIALPLESEFRTLSWVREGYWSAYPENHVGRRTGTAEAFPVDEEPSSDELILDAGHSWSHDATKRGSNDFRSTKRNVRTAELTNGDVAVEVLADGDQHVRAQVRDDGVDFLVLDRSIAGATPGWIDRYSFLGQEPTIERGTRLQGSTAVRFANESERAAGADSDVDDSTAD